MISIRRVAAGEERLLWTVFRSSIHEIARSHYNQAQLEAWAPAEYAEEAWASRIIRNRPFIAELEGNIVGFADIQTDGYIDQFFVSGDAVGKGIGRRLMQKLETTAGANKIPCMYSNVSRNAEPFFLRHGFVIQQRRQVLLRGVKFDNARMYKFLSVPRQWQTPVAAATTVERKPRSPG